MVERMGRGINLGNTFSAPVEGNWAPVVYEQYFIDVKNAGFTNVRIPMDFYGDRTSGTTTQYSIDANTSDDYNGTIDDYVVDQNYLNRIEEIVNWSLNQGLITIIDFHGAQLKSDFLYTFSFCFQYLIHFLKLLKLKEMLSINKENQFHLLM
jgi:endoglucanase